MIKDILKMPANEAADMLIAMREACEKDFHKTIKEIHKECRNEKKEQ